MKNIFFVVVFIFMGLGSQAQTQKSLDKLIDQTKRYLLLHHKTSPFEEFIKIQDLGLNKSEIKILLDRGNAEGTPFNGTQDSIESYDLLLHLSDVILENIDLIWLHNEFSYETLKELEQEDDLSIVISSDRKVFHCSLGDKHGGTYRSRTSKTMYLNTELDPITRKHHEAKYLFPNLSNDGINKIYPIESSEGTMYVLLEYVRGCSSCFESIISLIKFRKGDYDIEFEYSVDSRNWNGVFEYNVEKQEIYVNYKTDDLSPICHCGSDHIDDYYEGDSEVENKNCECVFKFNGSNFELVKMGWEKFEYKE